MDPLNMDILETEEEEYANFLGVESNSQEVELTTQSSHNYEDDTKFYKGLSFKNKRELVVSLKLASLKAPFRFKSVKSTRFVYCVKCVDKNCKWWLRVIKYISIDRFYITRYKNEHTCGSQHLTEKHPHASADVIGEYIRSKFEEGRGPSNNKIIETIRLDLGCNVSYWKCMKGGHIAKVMVRGTLEHGYEILDAYRYALRKANEGSKTALKLEFSDQYGKRIYDYTSNFYYIDTYVNAYVIEINLVPSEECWEVPPELVERKIPPPSCEINLGRRKTKRIPESGEVKKKQNRCSICKRSGHKRTTCKKRTEGTSNTTMA